MNSRFCIVLFLASVALAQQLRTREPQAQPPAAEPQTADKPDDKCTIEGQVVNSATGEPLRKASLVLRRVENRADLQSYSAGTDAAGHFLIQDIDPGKYRLWVERNGFVRGEYGARAPNRPGTTLSLEPGQRLKEMVFRLMPHAVIAGRVVDEDGDPVANVNMQAMRYGYQRGKRQLSPIQSTMTNDLGEYRLHGLAPGRYYLSATYRQMSAMVMGATAVSSSRSDEPDEGYAPTYYPSTNDPAAAVPLEVTAGNQMRGIDFTLLRTRTMRVRGRVINTVSNRPARNIMVSLMPRDSYYMGFFNRNMANPRDQQGKFEIRGVIPGSYTISAELYEDGKRYAARQPVNVGGANVDNINLTIAPGADLNGLVRVDGKGEINLSDVRVYLQTREGMATGSGTTSVKEDGSFTLQNASPDTYNVNVYGLPDKPDNFYIKSIRWGDQEVLATGIDLSRGGSGQLEVVLSPDGGQVDGVVLNAKQQPATGVTVALVPESSRRDQTLLYKNATTDQYGRFTLRGAAPGEYKLFAWEDVETGAYQDPEFLKPFENLGESVSIRENGRESAQLKLIPAEETPAKQTGQSSSR